MKPQTSAVHPDLRQNLPPFTFNSKNLRLWRVVMNLRRTLKVPKDVRIENTFIAGQAGNTKIRLRIYRPTAMTSLSPALLWLHGGGYILGRPEMDDACCIQYARELGSVIVSVDYRHAPEHPFPAALDDSHAVWQWLAAQAGQLGIDVRRMAIGGESAGGGLAAALSQLAHDRNEIKPVCQLLVYPMLDDRTVLRTDLVHTAPTTWDQASNRFGWESYLGQPCGAADLPAYAAPSRRADLAGLPPAWIGVGTLDLFHDEAVAYTLRLQDCGVDCELQVVQGAYHGFDTLDPQAPVVRDFRTAQIAALKRHLFPGVGGHQPT